MQLDMGSAMQQICYYVGLIRGSDAMRRAVLHKHAGLLEARRAASTPGAAGAGESTPSSPQRHVEALVTVAKMYHDRFHPAFAAALLLMLAIFSASPCPTRRLELRRGQIRAFRRGWAAAHVVGASADRGVLAPLKIKEQLLDQAGHRTERRAKKARQTQRMGRRPARTTPALLTCTGGVAWSRWDGLCTPFRPRNMWFLQTVNI